VWNRLSLWPGRTFVPYWARGENALAVAFMLLACASLHVSSLCSGGLRALLTTLPLAAASALALPYVTWRVGTWLWHVLDINGLFEAIALQSRFDRRLDRWTEFDGRLVDAAGPWITLGVGAVAAFVLLRTAMHNHHSSEHGFATARRQLPWLVVALLAGAAVVGACPPLLIWYLAQS
jgi:uncharacterized integral membrane protein